MEVKVCKNCRRLFNYIYGPELCQDCLRLVSQVEQDIKDNKAQNGKQVSQTIKPLVKEDEEKFVQVRDYIMNYPRATIVQIAEINKISPMKLLEWIKEERLEFSEESKDAWFECEKCGAKIKSGRLCSRCKGWR